MNSIITTTIFSPSEALLKYVQKPGWNVIIIGDIKTPHDEYRDLEKQYSHVLYLDPDDQRAKYPEVADLMGWNWPSRRSIAFLEAYSQGSEVIATIDDDNIPYESWGSDLCVGKEVEVDCYDSSLPAFDPYTVTTHSHLWQRGFPIQWVHDRDAKYLGKKKVKCLVQAALWDGDPDVDAVCRLVNKPNVKFLVKDKFSPIKTTIFNSQNTFLHRDVLPYYMMIPYVGRMDDIWGGILAQHLYPGDCGVVFSPATVYQDRNDHDLVKDMQHEMLGNQLTHKLLTNLDRWKDVIPAKPLNVFEEYMKVYKRL